MLKPKFCFGLYMQMMGKGRYDGPKYLEILCLLGETLEFRPGVA